CTTSRSRRTPMPEHRGHEPELGDDLILPSVIRPPSRLCPLSSVLCPLSSVLCPLSSVLCPLSSVFCPLSSVLCPLSSVLCPLSSVLCPLSSVLCPQEASNGQLNGFNQHRPEVPHLAAVLGGVSDRLAATGTHLGLPHLGRGHLRNRDRLPALSPGRASRSRADAVWLGGEERPAALGVAGQCGDHFGD